jgi:hypothetical protein
LLPLSSSVGSPVGVLDGDSDVVSIDGANEGEDDGIIVDGLEVGASDGGVIDGDGVVGAGLGGAVTVKRKNESSASPLESIATTRTA